MCKPGGKRDPLDGGVLYVKRKVGACSYIDDPIGCQSLSQAMHKVVQYLVSFALVNILVALKSDIH